MLMLCCPASQISRLYGEGRTSVSAQEARAQDAYVLFEREAEMLAEQAALIASIEELLVSVTTIVLGLHPHLLAGVMQLSRGLAC